MQIWVRVAVARDPRASFQQRPEGEHAASSISRFHDTAATYEKSLGRRILTGALGLTTTLGGVGWGALVGVPGPPLPPAAIGAPPSCEGTNGGCPEVIGLKEPWGDG